MWKRPEFIYKGLLVWCPQDKKRERGEEVVCMREKGKTWVACSLEVGKEVD